MKVIQITLVHAANLVANSGNIAYGVDVIRNSGCFDTWWLKLHWHFTLLLTLSVSTIVTKALSVNKILL